MFEYTVLPLGLHNAPSTSQRLMNSIIGDLIDNFVLIYLDDILVFNTTEYEHEKTSKTCFPVIEEAQAPRKT